MMKGHAALAQALSDSGVDTLFGLIGDANLFMVDAYVRQCGGRYVAAAHEAGAALMALGYAQMSGRVGVATVTHGPAMVNTLTALVEGVKGSIPMVLVCGDTAVETREHLQKIAQQPFVAATGAGFEQLRSGGTIAWDLANCLRRARAERRPIVLNTPIELQWADVDYQPVRAPAYEERAAVLEGGDVDEAVGVIASARRPLILAGRGAATPQAKAALLRLAARLEAPVATTLKAKDLFRGEANNLGLFGTLSTPAAVEVIMEADCIIAFGASLTFHTTSNGSFLRGKRIVQVNQWAQEIGKTVIPTAGMVGDAAQVADLVIRLLDTAEIPASGFCDEALRERLAAAAAPAPAAYVGAAGTVDFAAALGFLNRVLPAERQLVTDAGRFVRETWKSVEVPDPQAFVITTNFGSIGFGLSQAIGAAYARPDRPTVLVTGDGGFMHGGLVEFRTAVSGRRDLIVVVANDGCYGAEYIQFKNRQLDEATSLLDWPDLAPVAEALGGAGVTVRGEADLDACARAIARRDRPLLIDLKLDPRAVPAG